MEDALLACLKDANDSMKIEVLKAGSTLSEAGDARFTLAALNLSEDSNNEVRQTVRYVYEGGQRGILNLDTPAAPDPHLVSKVVEILQHGSPDSQAVVLPLLAALPENSAWEKQTDVQDALRSMLEAKPRPANYAQVLDAASSFKSLMHEPGLQEQVLAGLHSFNADVQRAAVQVSFEHFLGDPQIEPTVKTAFADLNASALGILLEQARQSAILEEASWSCRRRSLAGPGLPKPAYRRFEDQGTAGISAGGGHGDGRPVEPGCQHQRRGAGYAA